MARMQRTINKSGIARSTVWPPTVSVNRLAQSGNATRNLLAKAATEVLCRVYHMDASIRRAPAISRGGVYRVRAQYNPFLPPCFGGGPVNQSGCVYRVRAQ